MALAAGVGEVAEGISAGGVNDVHDDQDDGCPGDGEAEIGGTQQKKGFGKARQGQDRGEGNYPPEAPGDGGGE